MKTAAQYATASLVIALGVMALKLIAWQLTGSVALFSDALESAVNIVAALVLIWALRVAARPPDKNHPFGHQKAEYFSAILEGVMIVLAAILIVHSALSKIAEPSALSAPVEGLVINGVAAVINGVWAWLLLRASKRLQSPALRADGIHLFTDVYTSVGVILGLVLSVVTGWLVLDSILAMIVALNILVSGWRLIQSSVSGLMDEALEPEQVEQIEALIAGAGEGAIEAHDLRTRRAANVIFVEFHLVVDGQMSVNEAHKICDRLEEAIEAEFASAQVFIHVEPNHLAENAGVIW